GTGSSQMVSHDRANACVLPGFLEKILSAEVHRLDGERHRGPTGENHDRQLAVLRADLFEETESLDARSGVALVVEIEKGEVGGRLAQRAQRLGRARCRRDVIA